MPDLHYALTSRSTLRFLGREALAAALARAGFDRVRWFGDWQGHALTRGSPEIIVTAAMPHDDD